MSEVRCHPVIPLPDAVWNGIAANITPREAYVTGHNPGNRADHTDLDLHPSCARPDGDIHCPTLQLLRELSVYGVLPNGRLPLELKGCVYAHSQP